ncbi:hypothetical protein [Massilia antarctica]|uniref:hypothetical protein n=1 Tax=Massilia antarctica TaxID=2765360 RepID=UPI0006BB7D87|nr:hypothetical protein [Massilia sp. H27-R4]MCY0911050.1 hypothetical protein [Massilia sp. H27-R4]CUI05374.1 hypothetical protein BN2497_5525 [Janthinobacterium sp. CG23_2]CUU29160.1 hypothetical protein BN3177_5525 [Janthinobacterium sp. CG23_2]
MDQNDPFERDNLKPAEALLMAQENARDYFQGELYQKDGKQRLEGITIERPGDATLELDEAETGKLFMIPDGSTVWALTVREKEDAPAGLEVMSNNPFMAEDENTSVIVYRDDVGTSLRVDALYIRRLVLAADAPERLATVSFGLMAITAYRLGFHHIELLAAGNGPIDPDDPDGFVGFAVWPKFGFDAVLHPVEMSTAPIEELRRCQTVQDVVAIDPDWWAEHGRGREMRFDLTADSRSWMILLNYLYDVLPQQEIEL